MLAATAKTIRQAAATSTALPPWRRRPFQHGCQAIRVRAIPLRHANRGGIRDPLRFLQFAFLPGAEIVLLVRHLVRVRLNPGHELAGPTLHLGMELIIFLCLDGLESLDLLLPLLFV